MTDALRAQLAADSELTLTCRIRPHAPSTQYIGQLDDGSHKISIAAVPEDNKANKELVCFLAEEFGVPKVNISLVLGQTSCVKLVRVKC